MKPAILSMAVMVLLGMGCQPGSKLVPVSGVVTLDGKPLANANVSFQPDSGGSSTSQAAGSSAVTDANGAYRLSSGENDQPGAQVGKHRVEINLVVASDDRDPKTRPPAKELPKKYNRDSELTFEVPAGGTDKADFAISSK
jgi:hypothetical protein